MKKFGKLVEKNEETKCAIWKTSVRDVMTKCTRWSKNRPEDLTRVQEIAKSFNTTSKLVDGVVYAWWK